MKIKKSKKMISCHCKTCNRIIEVPDKVKVGFCSIECACYEGYFDVRKGWIK